MAVHAEAIARAFHDVYERLAPDYGYETREASRKPWEEVPENNRRLMTAVVQDLLETNVIAAVQRHMPPDDPETPTQEDN